MKRISQSIIALFVGGFVLHASTNVPVSVVRSCIATIVNDSLTNEEREDASRIFEFGFLATGTPAHTNLALTVSNREDQVLHNMSPLTTNEVERLVLLSAGWSLGEEYYFDFYKKVVDAAYLGFVSREELEWYGCAHHNSDWAACLALRFQQPGVSNVVDKYECVTGQTNYCDRIRTGQARQEYELLRTESTSFKDNMVIP